MTLRQARWAITIVGTAWLAMLTGLHPVLWPITFTTVCLFAAINTWAEQP